MSKNKNSNLHQESSKGKPAEVVANERRQQTDNPKGQ
jgi:hypothetical protein